MTHTELANMFTGQRKPDCYGTARMKLSDKQLNWLLGLIRKSGMERYRSRTIDYNQSLVYKWSEGNYEYAVFAGSRTLAKTDKAIYSKSVLGYTYNAE
ncbi:hypothetical protein EV210_101181 [Anaerospora hongkongensis]|uniref:Uncharacterized protein n=1 Tax=Anaerospora hongkongensis TaxID=244830 RepID=A0A4R1QC04_9FIRM|nr:hypothetical protein [Anaerospora hongkongensis]TCL39981.1 hypothetical protein EV210_101181 [Anaerospora hongkongensis]